MYLARPQCDTHLYSLWHTPNFFCELYYFEVTTTGDKKAPSLIIFIWESECEVCRSQAEHAHFTKFLCEKKEKNDHHDDIKKKNFKVVCAHDPLHPPPLTNSGVTKFEYISSAFRAHSM
jgi:hypothetical protein